VGENHGIKVVTKQTWFTVCGGSCETCSSQFQAC